MVFEKLCERLGMDEKKVEEEYIKKNKNKSAMADVVKKNKPESKTDLIDIVKRHNDNPEKLVGKIIRRVKSAKNPEFSNLKIIN